MTKTNKKKSLKMPPYFHARMKEFDEKIKKLNQKILTIKILELFDQASKYKKLKPLVDEIDRLNADNKPEE